jgi:hypothetical protein
MSDALYVFAQPARDVLVVQCTRLYVNTHTDCTGYLVPSSGLSAP